MDRSSRHAPVTQTVRWLLMKFNVRDNLPEYYEIHLFVEDEKYWAALLDENSTIIKTLELANEKLAIAKKTYPNSALRLVRYSPYIVYAT